MAAIINTSTFTPITAPGSEFIVTVPTTTMEMLL